jgi:thioredoxin reductase
MDQPVVIIGAGSAGLFCARRLVHFGLPVWIIEDGDQPGGQYFKRRPDDVELQKNQVKTPPIDRDESILRIVSHPLVNYMPKTTVWGISEDRALAYAGNKWSGRIRAQAVIVAAGAYDRTIPFPGWTLPGILTAGGCLNLIKGQGLVPGRRVAVVGNGPLLLVAADALISAGAQVVIVAEAAKTPRRFSIWRGLAHSPKLLARGLKYRMKIMGSGTPYLGGYMVDGAFGIDRVSEVSLAPIGTDGRPVSAHAHRFSVDTLVTSYGLAPSNEMTRLFECRHYFNPLRGGWIPERSETFETSVSGVFAIGDCAGISGAEIAQLEGEVVACEIARRCPTLLPSVSFNNRQLRRLERFRDALSAYYSTAVPLWAADNSTILCRCEEVSVGAILEAVHSCGQDLTAVKAKTRLSMGRCQGRNCLSAAADLLALQAGNSPAAFTWPRLRPPARLVPIANLLEEPLGPPRTPDQIYGP